MVGEQNPYEPPQEFSNAAQARGILYSMTFANVGKMVGIRIGLVCGVLLLVAMIADTVIKAVNSSTLQQVPVGVLVAFTASISMCIAVSGITAIFLYGLGYVIGSVADYFLPAKEKPNSSTPAERNS